MTEFTTTARPGRGRRPAAQLRSEVLSTAARLLFDGGAGAVTFERVAAETPCSKVTLYKWWASPGALAAEAFFSASEPALGFPDTGDVEADLRSQLHEWVHLLGDPRVGGAIARLIGAAQADPALASAWSEMYSAPRRRLAVERLERGKEQGQLASDVDSQVVVDQLWGACYHRLLLPDEPLTDGFTDRLVRNLLRGIAS